MSTAIWWIRRDLRLADNQALAAALSSADEVVPVFVLDPALLGSGYVADKRLGFLFAGLRVLDADLRRLGGRLLVRRGNPAAVLAALRHEVHAGPIYAEADVSPYAQRRDAAVARVAPLSLVEGLTVHSPDAVLRDSGDPYVVYTPYSRAWRALPMPDRAELLSAPGAISVPQGISGEAIPEMPSQTDLGGFPAGEAEAQQRLARFAGSGVYAYREDRERMDLDGTSRLSPYLRLGMVSARQVAVAALEALGTAETHAGRAGAQTWLDELIWREFYISILYHFPEVRHQSFREAYRELHWENDPALFCAWQEGKTGYPIVDAAMRQLSVTGWMHNRARMIVASFLTKDLLIDWRWGERHFMQHLIDGDPAANNGGWQWSAGTGTDAAPYFRIFNPVLQGAKYDPDGVYVRRWVPELSGVATRLIHKPWIMTPEAQRQAGCVIGSDYPAPIVDHTIARNRTLAAYKQAKGRRATDSDFRDR